MNGNPISSYRLRQQGASLDGGMSINRNSEIRLGYQFNFFKANQRIGLPILETLAFHRHGVSLRYRFEGQDDAIVARSGGRVFSRLEYVPSFGHTLAEIRTGYTLPISKRDSVITGFSGAGILGPLSNSFQTFNLGGPQLLGSYGQNEILARNYAIGTVGILHDINGEPNLLGSRVYLLGLIQGGRTHDFFSDTRYPLNASGAVVFRTLVGPIFLGGSLGDRGHRKWFFGVGKLF